MERRNTSTRCDRTTLKRADLIFYHPVNVSSSSSSGLSDGAQSVIGWSLAHFIWRGPGALSAPCKGSGSRQTAEITEPGSHSEPPTLHPCDSTALFEAWGSGSCLALLEGSLGVAPSLQGTGVSTSKSLCSHAHPLPACTTNSPPSTAGL